MALEVQVLTSRKGSNPGGVCNIITPNRVIPSYVKHCPGSHLPRESYLGAKNQPIYEAITNVLARILGLHTPKIHVLIDMDNDVRFVKYNGSQEHFGEGRRYYFVSELLPAEQSQNTERLRKLIEQERPYLDLLGICDVFDRRDNYFFYENGRSRVVYVDLGCSFVRAKEGWIEIKNRDKKEIKNRGNIKRARKELSDYVVVPVRGGRGITFASLVDVIPKIEISTLNPEGRVAVAEMLPQEEIEEIQTLLTLDMDRELRRYRKTHPHVVMRT
jgi:hypothetical protein